MRSRYQRGSSLIVSICVVAVLTVIGVAMVRFSAREQAGALASSRQAALVACARAAARTLQSQFGLGVSPTSALDITIGNSADRESVRIVGGHIDQDPTTAGVDIASVQVVSLRPGAFGGNQRGVMDMTNRVTGFGMNQGPQKVTAHCQIGDKSGPTTGRQIEVELNLRTGL